MFESASGIVILCCGKRYFEGVAVHARSSPYLELTVNLLASILNLRCCSDVRDWLRGQRLFGFFAVLIISSAIFTYQTAAILLLYVGKQERYGAVEISMLEADARAVIMKDLESMEVEAEENAELKAEQVGRHRSLVQNCIKLPVVLRKKVDVKIIIMSGSHTPHTHT